MRIGSYESLTLEPRKDPPDGTPGCENPWCDGETCQDCCPHDERDHGICLYCEHDASDDIEACRKSRNE